MAESCGERPGSCPTLLGVSPHFEDPHELDACCVSYYLALCSTIKAPTQESTPLTVLAQPLIPAKSCGNLLGSPGESCDPCDLLQVIAKMNGVRRSSSMHGTTPSLACNVTIACRLRDEG